MFQALATGIDDVANVDPDTLSDPELHHRFIEVRRARARLEAAEARLSEAWRARRIWADDDSCSAPARLARECTISERTARAELARAHKLATMPATSAALRDGKLSMDQAEVLCRANHAPVAALFTRDEGLLVDELISLDYPDSARVVRYWRHAADDEAGTIPPCVRDPRRHLHSTRSFDASIDLRGRLDAVEGSEFTAELQRLTDMLFDTDWARAKAEHGDQLSPDELTTRLERTPAHRRADALCEMARRSAANPDRPAPGPLLSIEVGAGAFARLCEIAADHTVVHPAQLIPHLDRTQIERIIFDPPRRPIETSQQRTFTGTLRRVIQRRDRHCQHPSGCNVPAHRCDIDHILPHALGGPTRLDNGRCQCPHHNRLRNQERQRPPPPDDG